VTEDPSDVFTDADALCAYMTSDVGGGRVCIVRGAADDPAQVSCDSPAFWRPTHITGIGTVFTLVKGPPLQHGHVPPVGIDVEVVGIQVPDDDLHAAASSQ
jgi:hypothetical protein